MPFRYLIDLASAVSAIETEVSDVEGIYEDIENRCVGKHPYRGFYFIKYVYQFMRLKAKRAGKAV